MNKIILVTGSMVGYSYLMEAFISWYSGNPFEQFTYFNRAFGPYGFTFWITILCNALLPQLFWFKKIRRSIVVMFIIALLVNVGMWLERFVIIVSSLSRDFLPSSWHHFTPTLVDLGILTGSLGFFFTWILLFTKGLPVISIAEVKSEIEGSQPHHNGEANG